MSDMKDLRSPSGPGRQPEGLSPCGSSRSGVPDAGRTLKERLARYMDPQAFDPVEARIKYTSSAVGKAAHDKRKIRREIVMKRAEAAIRFFMKPENAQAIEARRAETERLGAQHESAVAAPCANTSQVTVLSGDKT